ncbi:MAG: hypothetical protein K6D02_09885 [Lachnospiraceae bacterium]|nr:hypothetical protein [Lachnospiraceae bacterium]
MLGFGKKDEVSKKRVCANCRNNYSEGDKYCRYCGAPNGEPLFIDEDFACIYGPPPVERVHTCEKCGYTWSTNRMVDDTRYCPECGGHAPYVEVVDENDENANKPLGQVFDGSDEGP